MGLTNKSLSLCPCAIVKLVKLLLLLELGFASDLMLFSPLLAPGSSLGILYDPASPPYPLRELVIEFCLFRSEPGCALHRLLTLSERFMIALCTKPPMPFVGDGGRSGALASRACEEDIDNVRPRSTCSSSVVEDARSDDGAAFS